MQKIKYLIVSNKSDGLHKDISHIAHCTPDQFIKNRVDGMDLRKDRSVRVINLSNNYAYMSKGYYVSLLAQARGQKCMPSVDQMLNFNWKRLAAKSIQEFNKTLEKMAIPTEDGEIGKTYLSYFGRSSNKAIEPLSRQIFDIFRTPLVKITIKHQGGKWAFQSADNLSISDLSDDQLAHFNEALKNYVGLGWSSSKDKPFSFWLAVLVDPKEKLPPSNKKALNKLIQIGKKKNVAVELISKNDFSSLIEYDALFIRETTNINHHTYRFARKAEKEGIVVLDQSQSIIKCSNKVFLYELLTKNNISVPDTQVLDKKGVEEYLKDFDEPKIIKIPDGSFSRGVKKAETPEEFKAITAEMFKKSDILLVQQFMPTDYDWRIVTLKGEPLFACRYHMARGHWQIIQHFSGGKYDEGRTEAVALSEVPKQILKTACKATALIGTGLYGVDMKFLDGKSYIMEINDNPNIEEGKDDVAEGDIIYEKIIDYFAGEVRSIMQGEAAH
jgi:glutathione synthase/RimK-type ligase-like ATP-grasp enzyme